MNAAAGQFAAQNMRKGGFACLPGADNPSDREILQMLQQGSGGSPWNRHP
jgi:hypothetical protein